MGGGRTGHIWTENAMLAEPSFSREATESPGRRQRMYAYDKASKTTKKTIPPLYTNYRTSFVCQYHCCRRHEALESAETEATPRLSETSLVDVASGCCCCCCCGGGGCGAKASL